MSKIKPTSVLPYIKTAPQPSTNANAQNTRNALSTTKQSKEQTIKDIFGLLNAVAAYATYIDTESAGHLGTTLHSWRNRK